LVSGGASLQMNGEPLGIIRRLIFDSLKTVEYKRN
jgi:hypothetical protein